MELDNKF